MVNESNEPRIALYAAVGGLSDWTEVAPPPVEGPLTLDALCCDSLRGRLLVVVRSVSGDSPNAVWTLSESKLNASVKWSHLTDVPNGHRCGAYTTCGNCLVAAGGRTIESPPRAQKIVEAFDFVNEEWCSWPDLPIACYAASAINASDHRLLLVGGVKGETREESTANLQVYGIELFAGESGRWLTLAHMEEPCLSPSAAVFRGELLIYNSFNDRLPRGPVHWWDRDSQKWRTLKSPPIRRVDACLVMFDGRLVCIGGQLEPDPGQEKRARSKRPKFCGDVHDLKILW